MRCKPLAFWILPFLFLAWIPPKAEAIDPDPKTPPDSTFVIQVRPKQLMNSSLVKNLGWDVLLKTLVATNGPMQEFLENSGVDPFQHIDSIFAASSISPFMVGEATPRKDGVNAAKKDNTPYGVIVFRGTFNSKKLVKALETQGKEAGAPVKKVKEGEWTLWVLPVPEMPLYIGILGEKKLVIIGNRKEDVATCLKGGFDTQPIRDLTLALEPLEEKSSFYVAGTIPQPLKSLWKKSEDQKIFAEKLQGFSLGCLVTDKAKFSVNLITPGAPDSNFLKTELEKTLFPKAREEINKALESMKKSNSVPNSILTGYLEVLKKLKLTAQGQTLSLDFELEEMFLNSLQNQAQEPEGDK